MQSMQAMPPYGTNPPPYNGQSFNNQPYNPPYNGQPYNGQPYNGQYYDPNQGMPPLGATTPPPGYPVQSVPGVPPHLQPYYQAPYPSYPQVSPQQLYQAPYGQTPMPPTLTGQLRLSEGDELPAAYKLSGGRSWIKLVIAGLVAVAVAATVTLVVLRQRDAGPTTGSFRFVTTPPGADITYEGNRLTDKSPFTMDGVPVGTRHEIEIALSHYQKETRTIDMPKVGGEIEVSIILKPILGKLRINSVPDKAEIRIDGQLRGKTPITISDVDLSATKVELRLQGYQPYIADLTWPPNGEIDIDAKLQK
jgi:hypothetical protein